MADVAVHYYRDRDGDGNDDVAVVFGHVIQYCLKTGSVDQIIYGT